MCTVVLYLDKYTKRVLTHICMSYAILTKDKRMEVLEWKCVIFSVFKLFWSCWTIKGLVCTKLVTYTCLCVLACNFTAVHQCTAFLFPSVLFCSPVQAMASCIWSLSKRLGVRTDHGTAQHSTLQRWQSDVCNPCWEWLSSFYYHTIKILMKNDVHFLCRVQQ